MIKGVNMTKAYYMYVWECYNETPYFAQLIYANEKTETNHSVG
jgi:hypothetical protein